MQEFIAIDFETGNSKRVSACALGYAKVSNDEVNYKEAYELLYWLEDHAGLAMKHNELYSTTKDALEDDHLDRFEADDIKRSLEQVLADLD